MMKWLLFAILTVTISACAYSSPSQTSLAAKMGFSTDETPTDQAANVPSGRIIATNFLTPKEGTGKIIIKRDSDAVASACPIRIFLDAIPIADIWPTEKTELYLPTGQYALSTSLHGECVNRGNTAETPTTVKSSTNMVFRSSFTSLGKMFIQHRTKLLPLVPPSS